MGRVIILSDAGFLTPQRESVCWRLYRSASYLLPVSIRLQGKFAGNTCGVVIPRLSCIIVLLLGYWM